MNGQTNEEMAFNASMAALLEDAAKDAQEDLGTQAEIEAKAGVTSPAASRVHTHADAQSAEENLMNTGVPADYNPDDWTASLNPPQKEAVLHQEGPCLVLAGAGSGKTRVLTHRVARLLAQGVPPSGLLAVTFTQKAATEMRERIQELTHRPDSLLPVISTFHGFCVRLLRADIEGLQRSFTGSFTIYDSGDQQQLIKRIMKESAMPTETVKPRAVKSVISLWKNSAVSSKDAAVQADGHVQDIAARVYTKYQQELHKANALDFDDLLSLSVELLTTNEAVRTKWQQRFHYVLVDEYQDTNAIQYTLIKILSGAQKNVFVVGDDWQSIYGWRGADIKNILDFESDFPDATIIALEQNYRSTQKILDAADSVIKQNEGQKEKSLFTESGQGEPVYVVEARDAWDEARVVSKDAFAQYSKGTSLADIAVLYRTNAQSRVLERVLLDASIPYKIVGGVKFYDRKEVKDVLAYLRLLANENDRASLERVINEPKRGIGEKTVEQLLERADRESKTLVQAAVTAQEDALMTTRIKHLLADFGQLIQHMHTSVGSLPVSQLVLHVAQLSGLKSSIQDGTDEGQSRWENVLELASAAKRFDSMDTEEDLLGEPGTAQSSALSAFLEEVTLLSDLDKTADTDAALTLMTIHNAKGLEFHTVYMVGCEEGLFPHARVQEDPSQLEEETRLFYVAMTRAKRRLFMIYAQSREQYGMTSMNDPARFIATLPSATHTHLSSADVYKGLARGGLFKASGFRSAGFGPTARFSSSEDAYEDEPALSSDDVAYIDQMQSGSRKRSLRDAVPGLSRSTTSFGSQDDLSAQSDWFTQQNDPLTQDASAYDEPSIDANVVDAHVVDADSGIDASQMPLQDPHTTKRDAPTTSKAALQAAGLKPGVRVTHESYGSGVVVSTTDGTLTVAFKDVGIQICGAGELELAL